VDVPVWTVYENVCLKWFTQQKVLLFSSGASHQKVFNDYSKNVCTVHMTKNSILYRYVMKSRKNIKKISKAFLAYATLQLRELLNYWNKACNFLVN
jgi:hypothetical protein